MIHKVDLSGDYETSVYDAARRLLAAGANSSDTVETWRGGKLSMSGVVGWCAERQVVFRTRGLCLERYKTPGLARPAGETGEDVHSGMPGDLIDAGGATHG